MTTHNRTLGFEIEYLRGANVHQVLSGIREAGLLVEDERQRYTTTFFRDRWVQGYDGSCGWEIKSNPITDTDEVRKVMAAIRAAGGRVDQRCGLHVHMDVTDLTETEKVRAVAIYTMMESSLEQLLPGSRRGRTTYASSNRYAYQTEMVAHEILSNATYRSIRTHGKYSKLNLGHVQTKGTFEFRAHQGTLNFRKIDAWASICAAILNAAKATTHEAVKAIEVQRYNMTDDQRFENMLDVLLPHVPGAAARTVKARRRPADDNSKTGKVWVAMDRIVAEGTHACLTQVDGRLAVRDQGVLAAQISMAIGVNLATVRTHVSAYIAHNGLGRRVAANADGLRTYLNRRREALSR
jgi:hypothetical protein